ncbi:MAG: DUF1722 domain-containing protein [Candidatus Thermoplasmatota archaeon]|nr:DUF1722 domain-containing protein [Candidatus Thermoplasmatota archaeon]
MSRCLGFESCRYSGNIISSDEVREMRDHVDFITVCPEVDIGLGVPRDSVRLVSEGEEKRLVQPNTGDDLTEEMKGFIDDFLSGTSDVDGFILKGRSPTCGLKETRIYHEMDSKVPENKDTGLFGGRVLERYPEKATETAGRLRNYQIREHFLTKIFTFADFRDRKTSGSLHRLKDFHKHNRLLFRSYSKDLYEQMDRSLRKDIDVSKLYDIYEQHLHDLFDRPPECGSRIEVMKEIFNGLKTKIVKDEKDLFRGSLEDYKEGRTSLNVPLSVLHSWLIRFEDEARKNQSFFYPYPRDLVRLEDIKTCVSREYEYF